MNFAEIVLLACCCLQPCKSKDDISSNAFEYKFNVPEYTQIAEAQYGLCNITVFEVRKNGCHYGYRFSFFGLEPKSVILPQPISEIIYDQDSYQCSKMGTVSIDAIFNQCYKPQMPFTALFVHWNGVVYVVEVPVEEKRVHRHELD